MPIYEYACRACDRVFEELVIRRSDEAGLRCPSCQGREVEKVMSRPAAARNAEGPSSGGPARGCGPVG
jgi:putative FmdB family regulatory protein